VTHGVGLFLSGCGEKESNGKKEDLIYLFEHLFFMEIKITLYRALAALLVDTVEEGRLKANGAAHWAIPLTSQTVHFRNKLFPTRK
jgi:hypothetical protein